MPLFELRCQKCHYQFEVFKKINSSEKTLTCPKCQGLKITKLYSVFFTKNSLKQAQNNSSWCKEKCQTCPKL